jgi:hypothetical protein
MNIPNIPTKRLYDGMVSRNLILNKTWRAGQGLFNTLEQFNPEIANEIRGTDLDPFYINDRIPSFMAWLGERMNW